MRIVKADGFVALFVGTKRVFFAKIGDGWGEVTSDQAREELAAAVEMWKGHENDWDVVGLECQTPVGTAEGD